MSRNIANTLWDVAQTCPDATAVIEPQLKLTYIQLLQLVKKYVQWLKHAEVERYDRVALYADNSKEYLAAIYAIYSIGAITVPVNNKLQQPELEYICENSEAKFVLLSKSKSGVNFSKTAIRVAFLEDIAESEFHEINHTPLAVATNDVATIFYTSGTTGKPKGVMLSHGNLGAMTSSFLTENENIQNATMVYAAPISHGAGMYMYAQTLLGGVHYFCESSSFDPEEIFHIAQRTGNVIFFAAPTMLNRVVQYASENGLKGAGLQNIIVGGAPLLKADLLKALQTLGPVVSQIYGQGECPMVITHCEIRELSDPTHPHWQMIADSCGRPYAGTKVCIHKADENSSMGEILVSGDAVMLGYWRNQAATDEAITDGWLHTGDVGFIDEHGFVHIKDRIKDMIISGGSNVYSVEVENALREHPEVFEAAVFGVPDDVWGERVIAAIKLLPGSKLNAKDLVLHAKNRLADYKRPKEYIFTAELPKNNYGKIMKNIVKKDYLSS